MPNFDLTLVDKQVQKKLLEHLLQYRAFDTLYSTLDAVYIKLIREYYPLDTALAWLTGATTPINQINDRATRAFFWRSIYDQGHFNEVQQRRPDGEKHPGDVLIAYLCKELQQLPFEVAVNTWFATCVKWLCLCNIDQLYVEAHQQGRVGSKIEITPQYLAGMMEYFYY